VSFIFREEPYAEESLQRLFSTFANGWPGKGLALQRLATAAAVLVCELPQMRFASQSISLVAQVLSGVAGVLLLLGLWTPFAGMLVMCGELVLIFCGFRPLPVHLIVFVLGLTIAMIGPGAWSVDARLFGRKRIDTSSRRHFLHRKSERR
jgi:uncharacterized membrane protein YphA (DoxX/SURF4 family)